MQHIGGALEKLIKSNNLEKGLEEQKAVDIWEKVVGSRINENTEPLSVESGVLSVKTSSPSWSQELQLQKLQILKKLNDNISKPNETVKAHAPKMVKVEIKKEQLKKNSYNLLATFCKLTFSLKYYFFDHYKKLLMGRLLMQ